MFFSEFLFAFTLMRDVNSTLGAISDVVRGAALLTSDVLKAGAALVQGQVPEKY